MVPNVLGIQSQFSPIVAIWSSCIEDLRPVSRIMAKGVLADSREAFEALPHGVQAMVEHPDKGKWDQLAAEHTGEDGFALVEISKLASIHGLQERAKLTPSQSRVLVETAGYMGLAIEPDTRVTHRPYSWHDVVSLLRSDEEPDLPPDSRYLAASLMLELGIYIAAADGSVDDAEVDLVARFLESQFLLAPPDARRLEALNASSQHDLRRSRGSASGCIPPCRENNARQLDNSSPGSRLLTASLTARSYGATKCLPSARHRRRSTQRSLGRIPPFLAGTNRSPAR